MSKSISYLIIKNLVETEYKLLCNLFIYNTSNYIWYAVDNNSNHIWYAVDDNSNHIWYAVDDDSNYMICSGWWF